VIHLAFRRIAEFDVDRHIVPSMRMFLALRVVMKSLPVFGSISSLSALWTWASVMDILTPDNGGPAGAPHARSRGQYLIDLLQFNRSRAIHIPEPALGQ
jgi:hypothetical protein